jgi:hypothetical protein
VWREDAQWLGTAGTLNRDINDDIKLNEMRDSMKRKNTSGVRVEGGCSEVRNSRNPEQRY